MRQRTIAVGFGAMLLLAGCNPNMRTPSQGRLPSETPTAPQLVKYLNDNARKLQTIEAREVDIDAQQGNQPVGLQGNMICQRPRNFRLNAKVVGQAAVDVGSNDKEFWWWISKSDPPYLFHCLHKDYAEGRTKMTFPVQPDWIMEALGMAEHDPNGTYEPVKVTQSTFELVQKTLSPQRQPIRKVTVFNRTPASASSPQVMAHRIEDANGKEICSALITQVQYDEASRAVIPRQVKLVWPMQQVTLKLKLEGVKVNGPVEGERAVRLFTRPNMPNTPSYDLAKGLDQPVGQVQRVGVPPRVNEH
jgi:hypothetical protein